MERIHGALMWSFLKAKRTDGASTKRIDLTRLLGEIGDVGPFTINDAAFKFWLPEPVERALTELLLLEDDSLSDFLRKTLIVHCYGFYFFRTLIERSPGIFSEGKTRYSVSPDAPSPKKEGKRNPVYWVPELGKNIAPIKVWLPAQLKEDLRTLAEHVGLKPSQYAREIIVSRLLGHGTLPRRPESFKVIETNASMAWEADADVPWRETTQAAYLMAHAGRITEGDIAVEEK